MNIEGINLVKKTVPCSCWQQEAHYAKNSGVDILGKELNFAMDIFGIFGAKFLVFTEKIQKYQDFKKKLLFTPKNGNIVKNYCNIIVSGR